jgi:hypothetical protein
MNKTARLLSISMMNGLARCLQHCVKQVVFNHLKRLTQVLFVIGNTQVSLFSILTLKDVFLLAPSITCSTTAIMSTNEGAY